MRCATTLAQGVAGCSNCSLAWLFFQSRAPLLLLVSLESDARSQAEEMQRQKSAARIQKAAQKNAHLAKQSCLLDHQKNLTFLKGARVCCHGAIMCMFLTAARSFYSHFFHEGVFKSRPRISLFYNSLYEIREI
jgi:hypothetical protein